MFGQHAFGVPYFSQVNACDVTILMVDFEPEIIEECNSKLLSYEYVNTTTTSCSEIVYNLWEVRNSSGELLISLETPILSNLAYAFPYLDTFTIKLIVRDFLENEDIKIETYVIDECPVYPSGGPSVPSLTEKYNQKVKGKIKVINITSKDLNICPIDIKVKKIKETNL